MIRCEKAFLIEIEYSIMHAFAISRYIRVRDIEVRLYLSILSSTCIIKKGFETQDILIYIHHSFLTQHTMQQIPSEIKSNVHLSAVVWFANTYVYCKGCDMEKMGTTLTVNHI